MNSDATLEKARIRKQMIAKRRALSDADVHIAGEAVRDSVTRLDAWRDTSTVLTYIPSPSNEIDTWPLIHAAFATDKRVYCPRVMDTGAMEWAQIDSRSELAPGAYGIPEPTSDAGAEPWPEDAVVFVPGVAFTIEGQRLGHGGGYFDRFLARFPGTSIGLAYDFQIVDRLPTELWDQPVDVVLTPTNTYNAKR